MIGLIISYCDLKCLVLGVKLICFWYYDTEYLFNIYKWKSENLVNLESNLENLEIIRSEKSCLN